MDFFKSMANGTFVRKNAVEMTPEDLIVSFEVTYNYVDNAEEWKYPCTICTLLVTDPVQLNDDNDKYFCRMCILTELKIDKLEQAPIRPAPQKCCDYVDNMKVRCCFAWNGCDLILPRKELAKHVFDCPLKKFVCPNQLLGCDFQNVEIAEVGAHSQICTHQGKQEQKEAKSSKLSSDMAQSSFTLTMCKKCSQHHGGPDGSSPTQFHNGTFHGLDWPAFIKAREKNSAQFHESTTKKKVGGEGAAHFCGRVACKSAKTFGKDAAHISIASGKAGLAGGLGTTYVAAIVLAVATSPAGGAGIIAAPVIGGAVGLVIAIGGTVGGLLIGAGHAIATPFIELGKAVRKPTVYEEKPAVLVPWSCCQKYGSWSEGCQICDRHHNTI